MFNAARYLVPIGLLLIGCTTTAGQGADDSSDVRRQSQPPLAQLVRKATARFQDPRTAEAEGYAPFLGCVSSRDGGGMGIHYVNAALLNDAALEPSRPEALMYEPGPDDRLRLVGVEYLAFAEKWNAAHESAPVLRGHVLNYTGSPNRYGIPAHYELHVWAWENNANGTFADWNPRVSCDAYDGAAAG